VTGVNGARGAGCPEHHKDIICCVAFDRSSRQTLRLSKGLRRIAPCASVVAPRRLASNIFMVFRYAQYTADLIVEIKLVDGLEGVAMEVGSENGIHVGPDL
jgi:hypothetical protein